MASTYSPTLRIELIGNGEQAGTWGTTTNNNLGAIIEQAITGVQTITMGDATYTLTAFDGAVDEARNAVLVLGGTVTSPQNLIAPSVEKVYIVRNQTGNTVTIKTSGGNGVAIPTGSYAQVYCDGTNFFNASPNINNIDGNLTVTGNITANGNVTANVVSATTYLGVTGRIVQTVRTSGNSASTSSTGYVPTGHTATITPTSASSKILVLVNAMLWQTNVFFNSANTYMALFRNGSNAQSGDWIMVNANVNGASGASIFAFGAIMYLDSPATTSALTYQPYIRCDGNGSAVYNGSGNGTITLLEITA